jgi:hypothetical protein
MTEVPDALTPSRPRTAWVARGQALATLAQADAQLSRELADALPDEVGDDVEEIRV